MEAARDSSGGRRQLMFHHGWFAWGVFASASAIVMALVLLQLYVGEQVVSEQSPWTIDPASRYYSGTLCGLGAGIQALSLFYAAGYSSKEKRPAGMQASAYCALIAVAFVLDAHNALFRVAHIELYLWLLLVAGGATVLSSVWSILALQQGKAAADGFVSRPSVWASIPRTLALYPIPRAIVQNWQHPAAVPIASVITVVELLGLLSITSKATDRLTKYIPLHWTVAASGIQVVLAWAACDFMYIHLAATGPSNAAISVTFAYGAGQAQLLLQCISLSVSVSQSIFTFEESSRLKAERDAAQAELAVRTQHQQQAVEATEARQKFLRYVFHELRVPFNSLDMGLGMIMDDVSSSVFKDEVRLGASAINTLDIMAKAAVSVKVIINDTLDWTKLQSGAFKIVLGPACLHDIISTTILGLRPLHQHVDRNVAITEDIDPALPPYLLADKVRMQQVIANFISNAIKFAPHDGTGVVSLTVRVLEDQQDEDAAWMPYSGVWWKPLEEATQAGIDASMTAGTGSRLKGLTGSLSPLGGSSFVVAQGSKRHVRAPDSMVLFDGNTVRPVLSPPSLPVAAVDKLASEGYALLPQGSNCTVVISVRDNGDGIAASEIPGLFQAFRQLDAGMQYKGKGTGLGLAICHEIVSLHGGRVGVRSSGTAGSGAEFFIALRLPVVRPTRAQGVQGKGAATRLLHAGDPTTTAWDMHSSAVTPLSSVKSLAGTARSAMGTGTGALASSALLKGQAEKDGQALPVTLTTELPGAVPSSMSSERDPCEALSRTTRLPGLMVMTPPAAALSLPMTATTPVTRAASRSDEAGVRAHGGERDMDMHATKAPPARESRRAALRSFSSETVHASGPACPTDPTLRRASAVLPHAPALHMHTAAGARTEIEASHTGPTIRILCVDDVADNRKLLVKALRRRLPNLCLQVPLGPGMGLPQFEFDEAEDGHVALQMVTGMQVDVKATPPCLLHVQSQPARSPRRQYDLITMDAEMPTVSGFVATRLLRSWGYSGPVFGCTGNALEADQALFVASGVNKVFIKPVDVSSLGTAIHAALSKRAERAS